MARQTKFPKKGPMSQPNKQAEKVAMPRATNGSVGMTVDIRSATELYVESAKIVPTVVKAADKIENVTK